nr:uncharacterized protein LOC108016213 [Drosophila suzukii]
MAPFSSCSICQVRTRKMVKDPLTLKQIYVCPKEEPLKEVVQVKKIPKITPPLMQTVVIKNRKYVAISETADDE